MDQVKFCGRQPLKNLKGYGLFNLWKTAFNPLSANPEKWSNTLKQIVGNLPTICLSVFDHFMNLALKGLKNFTWSNLEYFVPFVFIVSMFCLFAVFSLYIFSLYIYIHTDFVCLFLCKCRYV